MAVVTGFITPSTIIKRDGSEVPFDENKIYEAVYKCLITVNPHLEDDWCVAVAKSIMVEARQYAGVIYSIHDGRITVEQVQDIVERTLQKQDLFSEAKHYILYRAEHARERQLAVPQQVIDTYAVDNDYFPTDLQRFQYMDKYSRWNYSAGRRETWVETVDRATAFLHELARPYADFGHDFYMNIRQYILDMKVMPSMRLMAMAGPAARRDNTTIYNCSYFPIVDLESFVEAMTISMAGCGVGYSVEWQYVRQLPTVASYRPGNHTIHIVEDSAEGWAAALRDGLQSWFQGKPILFNYDNVRPAGAILHTKGGRASGAEPLKKLLGFIRDRILLAQGRQLTSLEAHDIVCAIGGAVVSGGVRRTAMISLFDADDEDMLMCKSGDFERNNSQRWNANNSMVWTNTSKMTQYELLDRMYRMFNSQRGEPGIFSREAAIRTSPERRDTTYLFGTNPCGEINLRPWQFCNLSDIIARPDDTLATYLDKAVVAAQIGTIQSLATYFPNLRPEFARNCMDERLLGVGLSGQMDANNLGPAMFEQIQQQVIKTNAALAQKLGINQSAATTCVKPSGNSSVLLDTSSGLHARWARYYIRNVRLNVTSPLYNVLRDAGVKMTPENGSDPNNITTYVVGFPVKAPTQAITRNDLSAIDQLDWWLVNKQYWTEHNPSVTITYTPDEVLNILNWLHNNLHLVGGIAFLPRDDSVYDNLPYIEINEQKYNEMVAEWPDIEWYKIFLYESEDHTKAAQELACSAGLCEIE